MEKGDGNPLEWWERKNAGRVGDERAQGQICRTLETIVRTLDFHLNVMGRCQKVLSKIVT